LAGEILADKLYTVEEVAELLGGLHRRTVWRMLSRGELPGRKIGRRWYVRGSDLLAAGTEDTEEGGGLRIGPVVVKRQEQKPKKKAGGVNPRVIGL